MLLFVFPASMFAADSSAAMLYTNGSAWVNGAHVPRARLALFTGDLLQTRYDSVANINSPGSSIAVLADSLVTYDGSGVKLEHGAVTVSTSKGAATTAGDVKISPATDAWTEFNVTDTDGLVRIAARKGDLTIFDGKDTVTLQQGQETTRDETSDTNKEKKKKGKAAPPGASPGAQGGILNSPLAIGIGAGAIGVAAIYVLSRSDNPASPSAP